MQVAEQGQAGAKKKAQSVKKSPRLSDQEFSSFHAASSTIAIKHQMSYRRILVTEGIRRQRFEFAI
jgi:hypothetical protein